MPFNTQKTTTTCQLLPGAHFYIKAMGKFGNDAPIPVEIDLGESLGVTGDPGCTDLIKDAVKKGVIRAFETGRWRFIESAPSREVGPGLIKINGGS